MKHTAFSFFFVLGFSTFVGAQDVDRIAPRSNDRGEGYVGTVTGAESEEDAESTASAESVGSIKGIYLVPNPQSVQVDNPPAVSGIKIKGEGEDEEFVVPDGVVTALEPFIGGPLSLKSIQEISRDAILAYRAAGLPVVDIGFPEQNVSTGVLQLVIIVGTAGEITLEGAKYFDEKIYLRSFSTERGDVLWEGPIITDLEYLNRSPYRQVDLVFTPGDGFGEADLILRTNEIRPWSVYTGYENNGTEFIGRDRLLFGGEWGNAFGLDHTVGYQYTTTDDFDSLHAHAATYRIPIWQLRHELQFLAAYVEAGSQIPAGNQGNLASSGKSVQLSTTYRFPLPEWFGYKAEGFAGFDFKSTNNNLEFGGLNVFDNSAETWQFFFGEQLSKANSLGNQLIGNRLVWSPGDLSNHNDEASFQSLRALSSSDYVYWNVDFTQTVNLPHGFTALFEVEGQLSNANLLPAEALSLGGLQNVRGFEENLLLADEGVTMKLEVYAPSLPLLSAMPELGGGIGEKWEVVDESARFFAFYDQAWAGNVDLLPGEPDQVRLGGMGLGLDYRLGKHFNARFAHAWQVDEDGFNDGRNGRWHVSAITKW